MILAKVQRFFANNKYFVKSEFNAQIVKFTIFMLLFNEQKDKDWMMQLLAITCLSLASKMEETEVPFILDLQVSFLVFI